MHIPPVGGPPSSHSGKSHSQMITEIRELLTMMNKYTSAEIPIPQQLIDDFNALVNTMPKQHQKHAKQLVQQMQSQPGNYSSHITALVGKL